MLFIDKKPSWRSILLLVILGAAMYCVMLGLPEPRLSDEALNGTIAQGFISNGHWFQPQIYGRSIPGFPLYSWCVSLCSFLGMPNSYTLRLPSVLAIAAIALASGLFAWHNQSPFAGITAATVVITSAISLKVGNIAHNDILCSALLAAAWYLLYELGWRSHWWWWAWSASLLLLFAACLAVGAKALLMFYTPLFFLGRRLRGLENIESLPHITSLSVLILGISLWIGLVPGQPFMTWNALGVIRPPETFWGYVSHLFSMLPKILLYLFPWTFFAWAPFCLAMRQFEKEEGKLSFRYLRAIITSNAVIFWLMPGGSPLHLVPVLGPMAVLIGVYAEIVLRRYKDFFGKFLSLWCYVILVASLVSLLFWSGIASGVILAKGFSRFTVLFCIACSCLSFLIVFMQIALSRCLPLSFRAHLLWILLATVLCNRVLVQIPNHWAQMRHRQNALVLAGVEKDQATEMANAPFSLWKTLPLGKEMEENGAKRLYLALPTPELCTSLLVETFSMKVPVIQIRNLATELPKDEVVYVLSPFVPADTSREWSSFSEEVPLNTRSDLHWNWIGIKREFPWIASKRILELDKVKTVRYVLTSNRIDSLRLYRGIAKKSE